VDFRRVQIGFACFLFGFPPKPIGFIHFPIPFFAQSDGFFSPAIDCKEISEGTNHGGHGEHGDKAIRGREIRGEESKSETLPA